MYRFIIIAFVVCRVAVFSGTLHAQDSRSYIVGRQGGIEAFFTFDPLPILDNDLMGGTLSLRSAVGTTIVTFGDIEISNLHHIAARGAATPTVGDISAIHALYDSHLLISQEMMGGFAGIPVYETGSDDLAAANPTGVQERVPSDEFGFAAATYRGDIANGNGAFFLAPELQNNSVELARLVGMPGEISNVRFRALGGGVDESVFDFSLPWIDRGDSPGIELDALGEFVEVEESAVLVASVSDADDNVSFVEFFDNDTLIPGCSFSIGPYECVWTPQIGHDDRHVVFAKATDAIGNLAFSESQHVSVWTIGPQVSLTARNKELTKHGQTVVLNATAKDPDGVAKVEFFANDELISNCSVAETDSFFDAYTCWWTPEPGNYSLTARAHDAIGNIGVSDARDIDVTDASRVKLTPPATVVWMGSSHTLMADVSGPITLVEFLADDEPIPGCSSTTAPYECVWTPTELDYRVPIRIQGTDATGDQVRSVSYSVAVQHPINVTVVSPSKNRALRIGESVFLSAQATHEAGKISRVVFYANDESIPECSFSSAPYECEWTPGEGTFAITIRAEDETGLFRESASKRINVYLPGSVGIGDGLATDVDGTPVIEVDIENHTSAGEDCSSCDGGGPIRLGGPESVRYLRVPVVSGAPVSLTAIDEISDVADLFSYSGETPPIRFESIGFLSLGPFRFNPARSGSFSATYELSFDDGTRVRAVLHAHIIPEPSAKLLALFAMLGLLAVRRR